jgi:hypothetical protein
MFYPQETVGMAHHYNSAKNWWFAKDCQICGSIATPFLSRDHMLNLLPVTALVAQGQNLPSPSANVPGSGRKVLLGRWCPNHQMGHTFSIWWPILQLDHPMMGADPKNCEDKPAIHWYPLHRSRQALPRHRMRPQGGVQGIFGGRAFPTLLMSPIKWVGWQITQTLKEWNPFAVDIRATVVCKGNACM